jgi:uncharacterized protein (DUF58 family)
MWPPAKLAEGAEDVVARAGLDRVHPYDGVRVGGAAHKPFARDDREFWQFRPYQPGENVRGIDWRKSGAADDLLVRERQRHDQVNINIWIDHNMGMDFSSALHGATKFDTGVMMTLALAKIADNNDADINFVPHPVSARLRGAALGDALQTLPVTGMAEGTSARLKPGVFILFSDFWNDTSAYENLLSMATARDIRVVLAQVVDVVEITLPFHGRVRFTAPNGVDNTLIDHVDDIRDEYLNRVAAHTDQLRALCTKYNARYVRVVTSADLVDPLRQIVGGDHAA